MINVGNYTSPIDPMGYGYPSIFKHLPDSNLGQHPHKLEHQPIVEAILQGKCWQFTSSDEPGNKQKCLEKKPPDSQGYGKSMKIHYIIRHFQV